MKYVIICYLLLIGFQNTLAQSFQETSKYLLKTEVKEDGSEFPTHVVSLSRRGGISEEFITLTINDSELFEDILVTTLDNPGLTGVSEVIKMQVEYVACCAEVTSYYFIVKENQEIVELPSLTNVFCDNTNAERRYIFPNEPHGVSQNIIDSEISFTEDLEVLALYNEQSIAWEQKTPATKGLTSF